MLGQELKQLNVQSGTALLEFTTLVVLKCLNENGNYFISAQTAH